MTKRGEPFFVPKDALAALFGPCGSQFKGRVKASLAAYDRLQLPQEGGGGDGDGGGGETEGV